MIHFIYEPPKDRMAVIVTMLHNYAMPTFTGVLDEASLNLLEMSKLYLVAELREINGHTKYVNPFAIVATNNNNALEIYTKETGNFGSILTTLEEHASQINVNPC